MQRAAALLCIHAGAERRFRFVVMELGLRGLFRTRLSCREAESECILPIRSETLDMIAKHFLLSASIHYIEPITQNIVHL